ncbi:MAG: VCBS repeat-containing protein [Bacteroidota bacterium]
MIKQNTQPSILVRNRFAAWVGVLGLIAAGLYMLNSTTETNSSFTFTNVAKDDSGGDTGNAGSDAAISGNKDGGFAWGDINNDGYLDLVVNTNSSSTNTRILIADPTDPANPVFRDSTATFCNECGSSVRERSAILVDLNHDGYVDLIRNKHHGSDGSMAIYLNQGPAGLYHLGTNVNGDPNKIFYYADFHDGNMNTEGVFVADYNHDGWLDIIAENHNHGIDIFENPKDGSANFTGVDPSLTGLPTSASDGDYATGVDYDDDGDIDILARKTNGPDFFVSNGDGSYQSGVEIGQGSNGNKGGVVFGDFDNDGDFDFYWSDNDINQIWLNDHGTFVPTYDGSNSEPWASAGLAIPSSGIDGCAVGDVNNDGKLDLFLTDNTGTSFLFLNDTPFGGTLSFTQENAGIGGR